MCNEALKSVHHPGVGRGKGGERKMLGNKSGGGDCVGIYDTKKTRHSPRWHNIHQDGLKQGR